MRLSSIDKIAFIVSVAVFAFLYGVATQAFGWPPSPLLERAWDQARAVNPLKPDPLPGWVSERVYDRSGIRIPQPEKVQPGLTLIEAHYKDEKGVGRPEIRLIDRNGTLAHKWRINPEAIFNTNDDRYPNFGRLDYRGIIGTHLFDNGDLLVNVERLGTARLDACGNTLWKLARGNHHSIAPPMEDTTFWIPGTKHLGPPESSSYPEGFPGIDGQLKQETLLHVTADGKVLKEINVLDVLYKNNLERYIAKAPRWSDHDITHLNDVEPLRDSLSAEYPQFETGDLLVSLLALDLVLVIDPDTERVKWHTQDPLIQQHDPDWMGDGWIGIFDNRADGTERGKMLGGSRIVALHAQTDSMKVLFPTEHSDPFYTRAIGKWQKLKNGNLLLTESLAGRAVEVGPDGRTVWEWVKEPYNDSTVTDVAEASRYDLSKEKVEAWPCSPGDSTDNRQETTP